MRPRTEAFLAVLVLGFLALLGALLGRSAGDTPDLDARPSTFLAGPEGARGLLEAAQRFGIQVRRFRERPVTLNRLRDSSRQLFVILDPSVTFSVPEIGPVLQFAKGADLLLAGDGAESLIRCYGYRIDRRFDSLTVAPPTGEGGANGSPLRVGGVLIRTGERESIDSSRMEDIGRLACQVPPVARREPLLRTSRGDLAAVRLVETDGREVLLFGDVAPFRNRNLRRTAAGPWVLALLVGRYDRVIFEEYHHGFGASGSLADAALDWSRRSPWGWAVWQLGLVGLLALLFGAIRFGPARRVITRVRRSSLEHVRALGTALSAAGGHDEAIGSMIRGLRRRLAPSGPRVGGDWRGWLEGLDPSIGSPRAREALGRLRQFAQPGQPARNVRLAALAVEDLWQELRR